MAQSTDTVRRVFVAVDLADEVRHGLAAHLAEAVGDDGVPGSTPPPTNWHITLRFLGKTDQVGVETLLARLDAAELGPPFELGFAGLGAFPRPGRATVLWLGVGDGSEALIGLAGTVEEAVVDAGFMSEERPFYPHLTLSRIRPPQDVRGLVEVVPAFPLRQTVRQITVFESHLGRGPAVYVPLETFEVGTSG
jgi:2'-5' RNA ligase